MATKIREDKIGTLSHNAGTLSLAPSLLTIGGQQYRTSSTITRLISTDVTLAANTRYQVFAVVSGGVVALRVSTNENSQGPAGFTSWKLVGSFYSNGTSVFGSFVNIEGVPETFNEISFTPSGNWVSNVGYSGKWLRRGNVLIQNFTVSTSGGTTALPFTVGFPGVTLDTSKYIELDADTTILGKGAVVDGGVSVFPAIFTYSGSNSTVQGRTWLANSTNVLYGSSTQISNTNPMTFGSGDSVRGSLEIYVSGWSNTPIKDL